MPDNTFSEDLCILSPVLFVGLAWLLLNLLFIIDFIGSLYVTASPGQERLPALHKFDGAFPSASELKG